MELIMEFFKKHPNKDIKHPEIVDWVTVEFKKRTEIISATQIDKFVVCIKRGF